MIRKTLVFADAGVGGAGLDGEQFELGGLVAIEQQFGRAHGGAADRGRQHAVAVIGEENGVDQFGFAARELGDESHLQAVVAQFFEQQAQAQVGLCVGKFVVQQPLVKLGDITGK